MNKMEWRIGLALTGLVLAGVAGAGERAPLAAPASGLQISPIVAMGLTGGGETIATYRVSWYGETDDVDVTLGGNFFIYAGGRFFWPRTSLGLLVQGGAFVGGISDYVSSADLTRWPVEAIGFYETGRLRLGAGVTRHIDPTFQEKGIGDLQLDFEDATGTVYQAEYLLGRWTLGTRYVAIDYRYRDLTLDADHWGLFASLRFR